MFLSCSLGWTSLEPVVTLLNTDSASLLRLHVFHCSQNTAHTFYTMKLFYAKYTNIITTLHFFKYCTALPVFRSVEFICFIWIFSLISLSTFFTSYFPYLMSNVIAILFSKFMRCAQILLNTYRKVVLHCYSYCLIPCLQK